MKCQILFSRKNKKNIISLPSAKNAQRVVKVNTVLLFIENSMIQSMFVLFNLYLAVDSISR